MIAAAPEALRARAERLAAAIGSARAGVTIVACASAVGGGSLPGETLPSFAVAIGGSAPDELARRLRHGTPPVIGRIADDRLLLDVRTVLEEQEAALIAAVRGALRDR